LNVVHVLPLEQFVDGALELSVRDVLYGQETPAAGVGFEGSRACPKCLRKSGILCVTRAIFSVYIHGARLG
jgi:hypothetical protein